MITACDSFRNSYERFRQMYCCGRIVAAFTAKGHCVTHRLAGISAEQDFFLHITSIFYNHWCHCGACYYRPKWVTMIGLVTPHNSPMILLEINVYAAHRHFSLISFGWWWRDALFYWHFNSSSRLENKTNTSFLLREIQNFDTLFYRTEVNKPWDIIGFGEFCSRGCFVFYIYVVFENVIKELE